MLAARRYAGRGEQSANSILHKSSRSAWRYRSSWVQEPGIQRLELEPSKKVAPPNVYGAFITVEAKHRLQAVKPSDFACDNATERFFLSRNSQPDL
jgi:hypothetical protein